MIGLGGVWGIWAAFRVFGGCLGCSGGLGDLGDLGFREVDEGLGVYFQGEVFKALWGSRDPKP